MEIDYHEGTKSKNDKITVVDGHVVTFEELALMCINCIKSRKSEGTSFDLVGFLNDCFKEGKVSEDICQKYKSSEQEKEIAMIAVSLYNNEEQIYPRSEGYKGGGMLRDFLNDCMSSGTVSKEILQYYHLNSLHL